MPSFPFAPRRFDGGCRQVEAGAAFNWLHQGCVFFLAKPFLGLCAATLFLIVLILSALLPTPFNLLLILPIPSLLAGMLLISRELSEERQADLWTLLGGFRSKTSGLLTIGLVTALLLSCGLWCGQLLSANTTGLTTTLLSGFIATLLMIPVALALGFAPALHFFNDMPPLQAMKSSFNACLANWLPLSVFILLMMLLLVMVAISFGLGFFILIPILGGALFAAYRDIFPGT